MEAVYRYIHTTNLGEFTINTEETVTTNVILCRSFNKILQDMPLPIFTKKRLRYKRFNFDTAKRMILSYTSIILNYDNDIYLRLKTMRKLYNYLLIFISDLFSYTSRFILNCIYVVAIRLIDELCSKITIQPESSYLKKLKKIVKYSILKVINAIKSICINNTNILIRLPYSIFKTITNYNIYKIHSEYDETFLLDRGVANALNNNFKMGIIPIFIKKINIYIILYIIKFLAFKEVSFCKMFDTIDKIDNSGYLVIKDGNLIKIII
jgi:hypothetical protein